MKKQFFAALIGAALVFPMAAQAEGYYVGGNVGSAEQKLSGDQFPSQKESKTAYKVLAGYDFTPNFGAEAAYVGLGKASISGNGMTVSSDASAFYVAATGTYPINEQFSLFGKVGISANKAKLNATVPGFSLSDTEKKTTAMFGIGAAFNMSKNVSFVAEYENFGKLADDSGISLKANMFSAGVRYKF
ncbi:OOP family OmpA-OmpF porin [Oxalobacteraceae bacterium GrIS 1.11]